MKLSEHFSLSEFTKSHTAENLNIPNNPTGIVIDNLTLLCAEILEPLRAHFKLPIQILSGYRSNELNRAIGGAKNSQHVIGQAADFTIENVKNCDAWQYIVDNLPFDQCIAEKLREDNGSAGWVHVSYAHIPRKQAMSFTGKKYVSGLVFV